MNILTKRFYFIRRFILLNSNRSREREKELQRFDLLMNTVSETNEEC